MICVIFLQSCHMHLSGPKINPSAVPVVLRSDATSPSVCARARLIIQRDQLVDIIKLWWTGAVCFRDLEPADISYPTDIAEISTHDDCKDEV